MWRWPGQLPLLPLPLPTQRGPGRGAEGSRPQGRRRPALPAFSRPFRPGDWLIPPSPASLPRSAVTLPHCAEETKWRRRRRGPGARASVPPSRPLVRRLARGVRAHRAPSSSLSRARLCCGVPRAHVLDAHTPLRLGASRPARQERSPFSLAPPLCPTPASRRVPGSGGGKRGRLCPYIALGVGPAFLQ